jgi:hypothetical protein
MTGPRCGACSRHGRPVVDVEATRTSLTSPPECTGRIQSTGSSPAGGHAQGALEPGHAL